MSDETKNSDTVELLSECDSGTKMAVASIDEVLDKVSDCGLKQILTESREHHEKLGQELHSMLLQEGADEKEPNAMAKSMSWMKTNVKLVMNESDETVADLMTEGCDMGIKSLHRYRNQYEGAAEPAKEICGRLIDIEEKLRRDMQRYL